MREVACAGAPRTLLCVEMGSHDAPAVIIAAGVHGDEPAGALALLSLVQDGLLDPAFAYRLWPCTNPGGFDARQRESVDGTDLNRTFGRGGTSPEARAILTANRDRAFVLSLDLHEDDETSGFYCYEYGLAGVGEAAAQAVRGGGFPAEEPAVLRPDPQAEREAIGGASFTLAMARRAAARALTLESPSRLPLDDRIGIHRLAVKAAIAEVSNQLRHA